MSDDGPGTHIQLATNTMSQCDNSLLMFFMVTEQKNIINQGSFQTHWGTIKQVKQSRELSEFQMLSDDILSFEVVNISLS